MTTRLGPGKSTWKFYRQIIELNGSKWGNIVRYRKKNIVKPQDAIPALLTFLTSTPNGPTPKVIPAESSAIDVVDVRWFRRLTAALSRETWAVKTQKTRSSPSHPQKWGKSTHKQPVSTSYGSIWYYAWIENANKKLRDPGIWVISRVKTLVPHVCSSHALNLVKLRFRTEMEVS